MKSSEFDQTMQGVWVKTKENIKKILEHRKEEGFLIKGPELIDTLVNRELKRLNLN